MIRVAQSSVPEGAPVYFAHGFAEQLPFPAASFDLVLTTMSFHHWADQAKALREVRRVLVPGGVFALADAMLVGPLRWLFARSFGGRFNEPSTLNGMLQDAGLHVAKIVPVPRFCGTLQVALARAAAVRIPGSRQPS
jgi:SAM-dependent methyltransferase